MGTAGPQKHAERERMSSVDTAWLRMDAPHNLMMIVGVLVFDSPLDPERLRGVVQTRLLRYPRFRSRVVHEDPLAIGAAPGRFGAEATYWEIDPAFDLDRHLIRTRLPGKADKPALEDTMSRLAAQPLPPDRPLWEFRIVDRYVAADGSAKAALIVRVHHCIADGIALIGVMLSLTGGSAHDDRDSAATDDTHERTEAHAQLHDDDNPWDALLRPFTEMAVRAIDSSGKAWARYAAKVRHPGWFAETAGTVSQIAADAARLAAMADDSPTLLKGRPSVYKRIAWNEPLALAEVKAVGKALDCSVNDVLLSCVAGALRSYLVAHGEDVSGCELRAMVPVNLRRAPVDPRRADPRKALGNKFGLAPLVLPVGIENPLERLYEVRRRMSELKNGYQAMVAFALLGLVGHLPRRLQQQMLDLFARKTTAVMTNVPGPQQQLYLAGARLDEILFWVPQSGNVGVGVSVLSYNERVQFGLITAANLVADPEEIIARFAPEFERLLLVSLLCPWIEGDLDARQVARAIERMRENPLKAGGTSAADRPAKRSKPGSTATRRAAHVHPGIVP